MNDYNEDYSAFSGESEARSRRLLPAVLITVVITAVVTFFITWFLMSAIQKSGRVKLSPVSSSSKLGEIQTFIDTYFIGDVDEKAMADSLAAGMIAGLGDEWSYYIPAEDYAAYQETMSNSYVGIGVTITSEGVEKGLLITDVTPESPAYYAGLQIGDVITAVDGVPVLDGSEGALDLNETKNRVRGKEGTNVTLTVSRDGTETDYTITRAAIKVINVTSEEMEGGVFYIRIKNFDSDAADDTIRAIDEAMASGATGIVFDVRYNPGGYKHELVKLLDYILPEGPLFRSVDYTGRESVDYSNAGHIEIPMAVLVNYSSYSAAEYFAAALQEYGYAVVVGEQTYGKGYFQSTFQLSDGSAINISIGKYTTPNGVSLVGKGITPDYPVELTDQQKADLYYGRLDHAEDAQLTQAIRVLYPAYNPSTAAPLAEPEPDPTPASTPALSDGTPSYFSKLAEIQNIVSVYFIGDVNETALGDAAAAGLIDALGDEWSYYIPAAEYDSYVEAVTNSYVGIGVTITSEGVERGILITDVTPDSPAYYAGLQIGDLIVAVEGVPVLDGSDEALDLTETKDRVRGEAGTDVTITVSRDGEETDYTITRAPIKVVNVTLEMLDDGIAYIRIRNFEENAAADAIAAIEEAMDQGAVGIVFDVRYNPGGYKRELVTLLDYILPEGPLFRSVNYAGRESVDYSDASHIEIPMAVLVNYDSYSAAEFFAAALQEYDYAVVVGEQTYGKGRFQSAFQLADGSAINISIGTYTTPNGVSLVGVGITPDYVVEFTDEEKMDLYYGRLAHADDEQLKKAIDVLTNELP